MPNDGPPETALPDIAPPPTVEELCRRCDNDDAHTFFVAELAAELFHATRSVHELPDEDLPILTAAAKLHNIGLVLGVDAHHIHSKNLILEHKLDGFDPVQLQRIACGALFHRKKVRPKREPVFASLPPELQRRTLRVAAIVRVADGLDYTQDQSSRIAYCDDTRRRVRFFIKGNEDAAVNVARANEKSDLWNRAMPRPVAFDSAAGHAHFLRRGDTMQAAAYKVFRQFYADLIEREDGIRFGEDVEDLHQFRVAARRLRAALGAFRRTFGRTFLRPVEDELRFIARETNRARDLDVLMDALRKLPSGESVPSLWAQIEEDRKRALDATLAMLDGVTYRHFKSAFPRFIENLHPRTGERASKKARLKARRVAPRLLKRRLEEVLAFRGLLSETDDPDAMHRLRIACKKFRYLCDFFAETLAADRDFLIERMKELQDSLGELHDADVHGVYLREFLDNRRHRFSREEQRSLDILFTERDCSLSPEEEYAAQSLLIENAGRRARALDLFHEQWRDFASDEFQRRIADAFGLKPSSDPPEEATLLPRSSEDPPSGGEGNPAH